MRQRNLARLRIDPAPDQAGIAAGMMRVAVGAARDQRLRRAQFPRHRPDFGRLQRLLQRERWQYSGDAFGNHAFAAARGH